MKKYSERIDFIIDEILDQYMYVKGTERSVYKALCLNIG